jgi:hypothetical protein
VGRPPRSGCCRILEGVTHRHGRPRPPKAQRRQCRVLPARCGFDGLLDTDKDLRGCSGGRPDAGGGAWPRPGCWATWPTLIKGD